VERTPRQRQTRSAARKGIDAKPHTSADQRRGSKLRRSKSTAKHTMGSRPAKGTETAQQEVERTLQQTLTQDESTGSATGRRMDANQHTSADQRRARKPSPSKGQKNKELSTARRTRKKTRLGTKELPFRKCAPPRSKDVSTCPLFPGRSGGRF
jgi:hypothetical protein